MKVFKILLILALGLQFAFASGSVENPAYPIPSGPSGQCPTLTSGMLLEKCKTVATEKEKEFENNPNGASRLEPVEFVDTIIDELKEPFVNSCASVSTMDNWYENNKSILEPERTECQGIFQDLKKQYTSSSSSSGGSVIGTSSTTTGSNASTYDPYRRASGSSSVSGGRSAGKNENSNFDSFQQRVSGNSKNSASQSNSASQGDTSFYDVVGERPPSNANFRELR